MPDISVAVIDDHPIVCEGLMQLIAGFSGFRVTGSGHTAADAVALVRRDAPDIVILDLGIPGSGITAIRDIMRGWPRTRILVLTISEQPQDVLDAMRLGAAGYVLKGISGDELCQVLNRLIDGIRHINPDLAARILSSIGLLPDVGAEADASKLSKREGEIYVLIRRGCCNKEIGRTLGLSEKTVKHYLTNIFRKLNVHSRMELAMHAHNIGISERQGIVPDEPDQGAGTAGLARRLACHGPDRFHPLLRG